MMWKSVFTAIIYKVIEEMEEAMKGMLDPEFEEKLSVKQLFVKPSRSQKWVLSVDLWSLAVRLPVTPKFVLFVTVSLSMTVSSCKLETLQR